MSGDRSGPLGGDRSIVVVKIGTSSVTKSDGTVDEEMVRKLCAEVVETRQGGHQVVIVTSGAVTAGVAALRPKGGRPSDLSTLQALSAIGQHRLMRVYDNAFLAMGLICGQVLLVPGDFGERRRYLQARATVTRLLELGVVPIVNENDAVADDEFRFSDNDRLAALLASLLGAQLLVLLTDTSGLHEADPRLFADAPLVEEVREIDEALLAVAGGPGAPGARGGMASKLIAARMASRSGVRTVIAAAHRPSVLVDAVSARPGVGTVVAAKEQHLSARRLWIAYALTPAGVALVDDGARRALLEKDASLLPAGVIEVRGTFEINDAIEIASHDGIVFGKGLARLSAMSAQAWMGKRTSELEPSLSRELVHRDDLVILSDPETSRPFSSSG